MVLGRLSTNIVLLLRLGKETDNGKTMIKLSVVQSDITILEVDAIVNAANTSLLGGGGVDGAIHRAAGPELLAECRALGGCKTGEAKVTKGYRLPAEYIIHTVGPVWHGGAHHEKELLASCYRNALILARQVEAKSIAFPCISTGVYHFPKQLAAEIAVATVKETLKHNDKIIQVDFVCFANDDFQTYQTLLNHH